MKARSFSNLIIFVIILVFSLPGCKGTSGSKPDEQAQDLQAGSFGYDLEFLEKHQDPLLLKRDDAMVLISPSYQGRVLTSTATGLSGMSLGWINYGLIESGENAPHFNNYGGEERFWLGPEGGQFSIFFPPGTEFVFDNWQVPAPIDTDPYELVESNDTMAIFRHEMKLKNYSGFDFRLSLNRSISLLNREAIGQITGAVIPGGLNTVAYQSVNTITNTGDQKWEKESGLLSVWILAQLISSPENTVIVPFIEGPEEQLGPVVNDSYFGKVPSDRLKISDGIIYFKADGMQRGKIGLTPARARNFLGSYDSGGKLLTMVYYNKPDSHQGYVNSMWELQDKPFSGDVINSYNDGPLEDGSQLGPFYELETSSAAAALEPGASLTHTSTTIHVSGEEDSLNKLIYSVFGIGIEDIEKAFKQKN